MWTDVVINLDSGSLGIKLNLFDLPPAWSVSQAHLRSLFWGRLARYRQLELDDEAWKTDVGMQLVHLGRLGFGYQRMRRLVFSLY